MTPQPKPKTREEWERRLLLLEAARDDFARASEQEGPEFSERVAIKHGKNFAARSTVLDAIMSLQDEAERLRAEVISADALADSLQHRISELDRLVGPILEFGQRNQEAIGIRLGDSIMEMALKLLQEKARQAK